MIDRRRLPNRRACESIIFGCAGMACMATVARFCDGTLGEIFLSNGKAGGAPDAAARDSAVVRSLALQHGVPVETTRRALLRDPRGDPSSPLGKALDLLTESSS
jgi:hypothetical protein